MIKSPTDNTEDLMDTEDTDETRKQSFAELNLDTLIIEDNREIITSDRYDLEFYLNRLYISQVFYLNCK